MRSFIHSIIRFFGRLGGACLGFLRAVGLLPLGGINRINLGLLLLLALSLGFLLHENYRAFVFQKGYEAAREESEAMSRTRGRPANNAFVCRWKSNQVIPEPK